MSGFLFDTKVLLNVGPPSGFGFSGQKTNFAWQRHEGRSSSTRSSTPGGTAFPNATTAPDRRLAPTVYGRLPLPDPARWLAAHAFVKYRRAGGAGTAPLPGSYVGADAEVENRTLVTRDALATSLTFRAFRSSLRQPDPPPCASSWGEGL